YQYPQGLANAPLAQTANFNIDKNNFGPRAGVAWAVTRTPALRGSVGIISAQPILGGYEQALQLSGSPKAPAYTFNGSAAGAPAFPSAVSSSTLSIQSPWAVSANFQVARTKQVIFHLEQAFGHDFSASVGFIY